MLRSCLIAAILLSPVPVLAQQAPMPGMMGGAPAANEPASTTAYRDAMTKMSQGMAITYSQLRKLARDIIAAQQKEIAFMTTWQAKRAK